MQKLALWKWQCAIYAINGFISCTKLQKWKQCHYPMSFHLIMECRRGLGPVMQITSMLDQICNLMHCKIGLNKSDKMPFSLLRFSLTTNDLGSSWTFWKACNMLYNLSLKWILRYLLELGEKYPWSWVKNLPKLGQIFTKLFGSWTPIHKFITWDPTIFWENFVKQSCRFHGGLQLSCCKFFFESNCIMVKKWWEVGKK